MKLHELLECVKFDAFAPYIVKLFPDQVSQLPNYKEAYDTLLHTAPAITDEKIFVVWFCDKIIKKTYISVENCEGDYWEQNLGKEVVVADNVVLSDEELVARIMWSITFYGYAPDKCYLF